MSRDVSRRENEIVYIDINNSSVRESYWRESFLEVLLNYLSLKPRKQSNSINRGNRQPALGEAAMTSAESPT